MRLIMIVLGALGALETERSALGLFLHLFQGGYQIARRHRLEQKTETRTQRQQRR